MSRFFIGQRVRFVDDGRVRGPERKVIGQEGVIVDRGDQGCDWAVESRGEIYDCLESALEPILGTKHEACDDEFKRDLDKLLEGLPA